MKLIFALIIAFLLIYSDVLLAGGVDELFIQFGPRLNWFWITLPIYWGITRRGVVSQIRDAGGDGHDAIRKNRVRHPERLRR